MTTTPDPQELRDAVRTYNDRNLDQKTRTAAAKVWERHGIPNHLAAKVRAAEIEKEQQ